MTILEQMQAEVDFTDTEKNIIQYILSNPSSLKEGTIGNIAQNTYSSNATIVRFCKKLGFQGIRDFRQAFLVELESNKYIVNSVDYTVPFETKETTDSIINRMYSLYKEGIDLLQSRIDPRQMERIVECLTRSDRIFIMGFGDAKIAAKEFINKMVKINYFPVLATDNREELHVFPHITQKDCVLFITYGGKHASFDKGMKVLKRNHVKTMIITANEKSQLARECMYHIYLPDCEKEKKIGTFYSQLAFQYILNLLYALIYRDFTNKK